MFGGLPTQHRSKQNHRPPQQHSPTTYPQPLNINDLMRADSLALCLRCFANRVTDRERYIAPPELTPNFERTGWVEEHCPAGLERNRFPCAVRSFSVCAKCPNQLGSTPAPGQGSGPTKHPETLLNNPTSDGPLP